MAPTDEPAGPRGAVVLAAFAAAVMIAQQVAGKATRDALFLDHYGAIELPKAMLGSAVLSIVGVLATSSGMQRWGPGRLVPVAFTMSGGLFVAEWFLLPVNPGLTSYAIYLHMGVFGAIVISGFWSVVNERFDPHSAKKAVARIAAAATFGGLVGGLGAERVAVLLEPRHMLAILGVLNVVCAAGVWRVAAPIRGALADSDSTVDPGAGLRILRDVPYLQKLGALVLLVAMTTTLLDFALKAQASDRLESDQTLMQFFALFYTATGLATFAVQSLFAKRALSKLGLDGTIALLPAMVLVSGVLAMAVTRMWTVVVVKGVETVLQNSLFRSGYELLYTPISTQRKRPTKTIVDVAFDRVGDVLGSGVVFLVLWLVTPSAMVAVTIGTAVAVVLVVFVVTRTLHQGYVDELAESLRTGAVELADEDVVDATTRRTLSQTTMALDRERLLAEVAALRDREGADAAPPIPEPITRPSDPPAPVASEAVVTAVREIASGDRDRVLAVLEDPIDPRIAPFVIPLLALENQRVSAQKALVTVAPKITGALVDALLSDEQPSVVRHRVARVLGACRHSRRAATGLFEGLRDERFEVRYQCAQALSRLVHADEELAPGREEVYDAAIRELDVGRRAWDTQKTLAEDNDGSHWLDDVLRARLHRGLEHVFTILSLVLDRETLLLSLQALHAEDESLRGTALEYLENILPERIYDKLVPYLDEQGRKRREERRSRADIVDELLRSLDSVPFDRDAILRSSSGEEESD